MILLGGMDECSYGSWVGNVWAACVILDENNIPPGLNDSKKLSEKRREALYDLIVSSSVAYGVGFATAEEIDASDILRSSWLAMRRAVDSMKIKPTSIIVDGNKIPQGFDGIEMSCLVKADASIPAVSAASILAKVSRTREMEELAKVYPMYGFDKHQGYGTKAHSAALEKYGALPMHRKSYAPIKKIIGSSDSGVF